MSILLNLGRSTSPVILHSYLSWQLCLNTNVLDASKHLTSDIGLLKSSQNSLMGIVLKAFLSAAVVTNYAGGDSTYW